MVFHESNFSFVEKVSKSPMQSLPEEVITIPCTMLVACLLPTNLSSSTSLSSTILGKSSLPVSNANPNFSYTPSVLSITSVSIIFLRHIMNLAYLLETT